MLNERGFKRALDSNLDIANYVIVASDTFSLRNQGATTRDNLKVLKQVFGQAQKKIEIATKLNKFQKFKAAKTICNKKNNQNMVEAIINPRDFANIVSFTINANNNFISN